MNKKKNYMYYEQFRNIPKMIKNWKSIVWASWLGKCPACKSKRIHFIEGRPKFSKWLCTDCTTMSYVTECKKCGHEHYVQTKYKPHIFKEYRLGKYKNDETFFSACQQEYFLNRIHFHTQGLEEWLKLHKEWKKRKHRSVLYSKG